MPPDVRRGFAPPFAEEISLGYALRPGFAHKARGRTGGLALIIFQPLTARLSLASHPAAKPTRRGLGQHRSGSQIQLDESQRCSPGQR
jgi:hypothetical protein